MANFRFKLLTQFLILVSKKCVMSSPADDLHSKYIAATSLQPTAINESWVQT